MFRWLHHIASFLLLVAAILLIVVSVSSPVAHDIGFLKVNLFNHGLGSGSKLVFGNWGYCITIPHANDQCTKSHLGYDPVSELIALNAASGSDYSSNTRTATRRLTKAFVLHPIACGLSVLAFIMGVGASVCGSFCAALAAALSCVVTLVAMAIDFWLFGRIKSGINNHSSTGATASWSSCVWLCMVAFLLSFAGMVLMLLTCCTRDKGTSSPRTRRTARSGNKF